MGNRVGKEKLAATRTGRGGGLTISRWGEE
jgi:hypothetical protein